MILEWNQVTTGVAETMFGGLMLTVKRGWKPMSMNRCYHTEGWTFYEDNQYRLDDSFRIGTYDSQEEAKDAWALWVWLRSG